jgi:hypothetical protein
MLMKGFLFYLYSAEYGHVCFLSLYTSLPLQEDQSTSDKSDDLVKVLRELTVVQRNIANLQVELQGRKVMD